MEKCGHFLSWSGSETDEEVETEIGTTPWKYAIPLREEEEKSMDDLKVGCEVIDQNGDTQKVIQITGELVIFADGRFITKILMQKNNWKIK